MHIDRPREIRREDISLSNREMTMLLRGQAVHRGNLVISTADSPPQIKWGLKDAPVAPVDIVHTDLAMPKELSERLAVYSEKMQKGTNALLLLIIQQWMEGLVPTDQMDDSFCGGELVAFGDNGSVVIDRQGGQRTRIWFDSEVERLQGVIAGLQKKLAVYENNNG